MKTKLNEAFPIVAAALGNRLGVRVMVTGQTARTDGEMIVIPAYDGEDPKYRDVAWGYLAHEAAHIRYTDFGIFKSACTTPIRKAILNIIEDVRIEKRLAQSYPGTRFTIEKTVAQLIAEGGYEAPSEEAHPASILQASLLFGLRSEVLGQTLLRGMAKSAEDHLKAILPFNVFDELSKLHREVEGLRDTQEALNLTDRILELWADDQEEPRRDDAVHQKHTDHVGDGDDARNDPSNDGNQDSALAGTGAHQSFEGSSRDGGETMNPCMPMGQILSASESDLQGDLFDTIREGLTLAREQSSTLTLPVADEPPMDPVQGKLLLEKSLRESGKLRASLQGLVQANRLSKPVTRRSGHRMESNRLSRLGLGDSRVFRRMDIKKSPNTAVHILLDRSPSMSASVASGGRSVGRRIDLALEATLSLALALEGIQGVNVGITAFPGKDGEGTSVYRLLPHGSNIRNRVAAFGTELDGSTPLAEAVWYAGAQLLQQREDKKILFVLTDGIPDDLETTQDVLEKCHHARIDVTGIGLGIEVDRLFESSVCVMQMGELSKLLHEICRDQMID